MTSKLKETNTKLINKGAEFFNAYQTFLENPENWGYCGYLRESARIDCKVTNCYQHFGSWSTWKVHMDSVHPDVDLCSYTDRGAEVRKIAPLECKFCRKLYTRPTCLQKHILSKHAENGTEINGTEDAMKKDTTNRKKEQKKDTIERDVETTSAEQENSKPVQNQGKWNLSLITSGGSEFEWGDFSVHN